MAIGKILKQLPRAPTSITQVTRITDQLKEWMDPQGPSLQTAWPMTQAQDPIAIANRFVLWNCGDMLQEIPIENCKLK